MNNRPTAEQLRALGVSQPHAWKLAHGRQLPSFRLAQRIEQELGYPASAWKLEQAA